MAEQAQNRKSAEDIIREYIQKQRINVKPEAVLAALSELVKRPDYRLFRTGDTMFIIRNFGNGLVEFHMANIEPPMKLIRNVKEFYQAMKKAGFKQLITKTTNYDMIRIAQMANIDHEVSDNGDYYTMKVRLV